MLLVLLWWVLQVVVLVLVLGHRQCQLESVSMLQVRLFQLDHLAGQMDQRVPLLATEHLCCQMALVWVLLVRLSLMMGQLCCQQEPPSPGQVRPVGCNTTTACTVKLDIGSPMDQNSGTMHHQHDRQVLCRSTLAMALEAGWAAVSVEDLVVVVAEGWVAGWAAARVGDSRVAVAVERAAAVAEGWAAVVAEGSVVAREVGSGVAQVVGLVVAVAVDWAAAVAAGCSTATQRQTPSVRH